MSVLFYSKLFFAAAFLLVCYVGGVAAGDQSFEKTSSQYTSSFINKQNKNAFSSATKSLAANKKLDFTLGQALFERLWVSAPASTQAADGLGPLYNARACSSCHFKNGRGKPPAVNENAVSMLLKIDIPAQNKQQQQRLDTHKVNNIPDPVYGLQLQSFSIAGHKAEYRLQLTYQNVDVRLSDGEVITLRKPAYKAVDLAYGELHKDARLSPRIAPQMIGLGLLESITEADVLALADENDKNGDAISGRVNTVWNHETNQLAIGRFGHKAGMPSVNQQSQAAFFNDIGISTPLFYAAAGDCTIKQIECMAAPNGNSPQYDNLEAPKQVTDLVTLYASNIAVPLPRNANDADTQAGGKIFNAIGCNSCHVSAFEVVHNGRRQLIHPYTDLLLHDMGSGLADNRPEGVASGNEWRTAPLWGIGLTPVVSGHNYYLHDGRAANLLEAILWHGGEAKKARDAVVNLNSKQRKQLLKFIKSI